MYSPISPRLYLAYCVVHVVSAGTLQKDSENCNVGIIGFRMARSFAIRLLNCSCLIVWADREETGNFGCCLDTFDTVRSFSTLGSQSSSAIADPHGMNFKSGPLDGRALLLWMAGYLGIVRCLLYSIWSRVVSRVRSRYNPCTQLGDDRGSSQLSPGLCAGRAGPCDRFGRSGRSPRRVRPPHRVSDWKCID